MALINKNTKILVSPPSFLRVKEFFGNSGQLDSAINKWLEENEYEYDFIDIKLASCQFRDSQTKTTALVLYKPKSRLYQNSTPQTKECETK